MTGERPFATGSVPSRPDANRYPAALCDLVMAMLRTDLAHRPSLHNVVHALHEHGLWRSDAEAPT